MSEEKKIMTKVDCPFCLNGIIVEAKQDETGQKLADRAAMACNCMQSREWRTERRIRQKLVNDLVEEEAVNGIFTLIDLVKNDLYDGATVKFGKITYSIGKNAKGALKFKRNHSETEEQTL